MIEFLSGWAKSLGVTIVVVSILEMLLPNNKTKKYIRMVMGVFVLFQIISPFIQNEDLLKLDNIDVEKYATTTTTAINQTSMDERIKELYIEEMEKDISNKIEEKGYEVLSCKVKAEISLGRENENKINKIIIKIQKNNKEKNKQESNNNEIENKIVSEIQKIKPVDTTIKKNVTEKTEDKENLSKIEIQNIKKFLIEEYGVNEKCLEIN